MATDKDKAPKDEWPIINVDGTPVPPDSFDNDFPPPRLTPGENDAYLRDLIASYKAEDAEEAKNKK